MSFKNTLLMAVVLAIVALFIFRVELPESERIEREQFLLRKAEDAQIRRISISSSSGAFVFTRPTNAGEKSGWALEGVPEAVLDTASVSALIGALQSFKSDSVIPVAERAVDYTVYGLKEPSLKMEIESSGTKTAIEFGKLNEFLGKRYAQVTPARGPVELMLADDVLYKAAAKPIAEFREKNPIQFSDTELRQVIADWNGARIVFALEGTAWKIKEPVIADADFESVIGVVREIRGFKAAQYFDGVSDQAKYHLDAPQMKVEFSFSDSRKPIVVMASAGKPPSGEGKAQAGGEPMYFSLGGTTIYQSAENPLAKIIKPLREFRQRQLFTFEADSVSKLEIIERAGNSSMPPLVMENVGTKWMVNGVEGDAVFILQLINDLAVLEAADFPLPSQKDFGFDSALRRFTLTMKDAQGAVQTRTLTIGKSTAIPSGGKGYFALDSQHTDAPFILTEAAVQKLTPKPEALRKSVATPAPL